MKRLTIAQERILDRYYGFGYRDSGKVFEARSVNILIQEGYLQKKSNPDSPNIPFYCITHAGKEYLQQVAATNEPEDIQHLKNTREST